MIRRSGWLGLGLALVALVGCEAEAGPDEVGAAEPVASTSEALAVDTLPSNDEACETDRWVGITQSPQSICPAPQQLPGSNAQWALSSPFSGSKSPSLLRYCLYEWRPNGTTTAPPLALLPRDGVRPPAQWLSRDCHVSAPLATTPAEDAARADLAAQFASQTNPVDQLPPNGSPAPVRVAVVDTSPDPLSIGTSTLGRDDHGYAVERLIQGLTCTPSAAQPSGACNVSTVSYLGLPLFAQTASAAPLPAPVITLDNINGGDFGTPVQLASAINRAVEDYLQLAGQGTPAHLVINLSVGWEPKWGGNFPGRNWAAIRDASIRAAYESILHASCYGAIVIAAAGNDPGGPTPSTGPMYPAAWELKTSPTDKECIVYERDPNFRQRVRYNPISAPNSYTPLVYAVGGVDGRDYPIANARRLGMPRLVAAADQSVATTLAGTATQAPDGTVSSSKTDTWTAPRTGTSISAAVATAAASLVWSYRPELTPAEVMELVYRMGVDLTSTAPAPAPRAQFCAPGFLCFSQKVRRVSICDAVAKTCSAWPARCGGSAPSCTAKSAYAGAAASYSPATLAALDAFYATAAVATASTDLATPDLTASSVCGGPVYNPLGVATPDAPCPNREFYNAALAPWCTPQPGGGGGGTGPDSLTMKTHIGTRQPAELSFVLNPGTTVTPTSVSLVITYRSGAPQTYPLTSTLLQASPISPLGLGHAYRVTNLDLTYHAPGDIAAASIVYGWPVSTTRSGSSSKPVIITWGT